MSTDVVVVGAGCAGTAAAYFLAKAGANVTLLEKKGLAAGSSGHSTGVSGVMLRDTDMSAHADLNRRAISRLEKAIPLLEDLTGHDIQYQLAPGMIIPLTEEAWEQLKITAPPAGQKVISGSAARELEPGLGPEVLGAAWEPLRRKLDSQSLTRMYARGAEMHGAKIVFEEAVGFQTSQRRVTGVKTASGTIPCGAVVVAMGVNASDAGKWLGVRVPVRPIKGEALRLHYDGPRAQHLLTPIGLRPGFVEAGHVIFRKDGVVSLGSTIEDTGYVDEPTQAARDRILRMAEWMWPALKTAEVFEHVHGLRPVPEDGLPILGPITGVEGAFVISGHAVCACSSMYAEITTDLIFNGSTTLVDNLDPFLLTRFDSAQEGEREAFGIMRHVRAAAPVIKAQYTG